MNARADKSAAKAANRQSRDSNSLVDTSPEAKQHSK